MLQTYILSADIAAILQARFEDRHFEVPSRELYESYAFTYTVDKEDFRYSEQRVGRNMYPVVEKLVYLNFIVCLFVFLVLKPILVEFSTAR
jgi:hypothetical protein